MILPSTLGLILYKKIPTLLGSWELGQEISYPYSRDALSLIRLRWLETFASPEFEAVAALIHPYQ